MNYNRLADDLFDGLVRYSQTRFCAVPAEFSTGEVGVLVHLSMMTDDASAGELSERLGLSTARVAAVLNTLEKKKMITRRRSAKDRRKVFVHITDYGRELVNKKRHEGLECAEALLERLGENDARALVRIVGRISE